MTIKEIKQVRPQEGLQEAVLSTPADIAITGGAAGACKTFSLLMDPIRHFQTKGFNAVIFRRTAEQIRKVGSLWDQSYELYPYLGGRDRENVLDWTFPKRVKVKMDSIQYEKDLDNHHSSQICALLFDELQQFTRKMFFYMLSRNRSTCGVRPYVRGGCNPDPDSFLRDFLDWWIGEDGYPIEERGGIIRWMVREANDELRWFDFQGDAIDYLLDLGIDFKLAKVIPKSVTFLPGKVTDNKILMEKDPGYIANLEALNRVDRERLLHGNWNIRESSGDLFQSGWFEIIELPEGRMVEEIRYWDRAATKPNPTNPNPDWTVGCRMGKNKQNHISIIDVKRLRDRPAKVKELIINTAKQDGKYVTIGLEQEPGASGKYEVDDLTRELAGYKVKVYPATTAKVTRAKPFSSYCQNGHVSIVKGKWNRPFLDCLQNFPDGDHDDDVDAGSGAFNYLNAKKSIKVSSI